jgi:16S rRNA (cytidine1402-2'-O)-methyltransferase
LVAFESPRRVAGTLKVLADLDPERRLAVCRELTKVHEEIVRGTAGELAERYREKAPRGEVVLVVAPPEKGADGVDAGEPAGLDAVTRLVESGAKVRDAASVVGELTGESANSLYRAYTKSRRS